MLMSACGVLCSDCPAYHGAEKGPQHQARVVEAWTRIYQRPESPASIACGGCLSSDADVFYTSVGCTCRLCCRGKGFGSCAECPQESCDLLEHAQAVWDGVPAIGKTLTPEDYRTYAQPYCAHRQRLAEARERHARR